MTGRAEYATALLHWERLAARLAPGSEAQRELQSAIQHVRLAAGTR